MAPPPATVGPAWVLPFPSLANRPMLPRHLQGRTLKNQGNYHRKHLLIFNPRLTRGSHIGTPPVSSDSHEPEVIRGHHYLVRPDRRGSRLERVDVNHPTPELWHESPSCLLTL